jgi:hypothetical protein
MTRSTVCTLPLTKRPSERTLKGAGFRQTRSHACARYSSHCTTSARWPVTPAAAVFRLQVGLNLYVASMIAGMRITDLAVAALPWLLTMLVFMVIVTYWPGLTLFLPRLLGMM